MAKTSGAAKKKLILLGIIFLLVILFTSFNVLGKDEFKRKLDSWGVNMDLGGFRLTDFVKDQNREELEAARDNTIVKITKNKTPDHKKLIEDRKFLLASLFEPTTSPYPEVITNVVSCPPEFKPKTREVQNGTIYTLFAGGRFNYGICSKDLVKYNSAYGIFDCNKKGVFEIKIFGGDEQDIKNLIQTFSC